MPIPPWPPAYSAQNAPRRDRSGRNGEDIVPPGRKRPAWTKIRRPEILADPSGRALAVACKGAGLNRAALLRHRPVVGCGTDLTGAYACWNKFDAVPVAEGRTAVARLA